MGKHSQEQPMIVVPVEYLSSYTSSSEYHIPRESNALGKKAVEGIVNFVPGVTLVSTGELTSDPEIVSVSNPRKVPGTAEYEQEQNRLASIARSEWVASNVHNRE